NCSKNLKKKKKKKKSDTEKKFLKDLYNFMKKGDSPIERIPNLGFKQIDLFLMFTTVQDLGGYHQVTAQQLWKQVYNTLGGNPRSTSAATCTRRHYEKLLLPYEFHMKGLSANIFNPHQQKPFLSADYNRHGSAFRLPLHYPHYHHQNHAILPPHVPITSLVLPPPAPPAPQPQFPFIPYCLKPAERVKEPLEHLRYLAEQYKSSSGLTEPLNLSVKGPRRETNSIPVSSFSPPSSSKNPKFLNKPSPLYSLQRPQGARNEEGTMQDEEAALGGMPYSFPGKDGEACTTDVRAVRTSGSPTYDPALQHKTEKGTATMVQNPSSPKADFTQQAKERRERSPEKSRLGLSNILPSLPRENERGEMEIEIPLSMFHNWLRLCRSSATTPEQHQSPTLLTLEEKLGQRTCSDTGIVPTIPTCRLNPQHSSVAEDLRLRQRNLPSPMQAIQTTSNHHKTSQSPVTSFKPYPSGGLQKNAASQDSYLFDRQNINKSYSSKHPNGQVAYDQESIFPAKLNSNLLTAQQNFGDSKSYYDEAVHRGRQELSAAPAAVLMLNSDSSSVLHLTTEELMKLKKIISSSS
uniref:ARID domain-containing protein n=1 Tax=Mola mola TaxID=94237 RepID=A0A3Q3WL96_MOLML